MKINSQLVETGDFDQITMCSSTCPGFPSPHIWAPGCRWKRPPTSRLTRLFLQLVVLQEAEDLVDDLCKIYMTAESRQQTYHQRGALKLDWCLYGNFLRHPSLWQPGTDMIRRLLSLQTWWCNCFRIQSAESRLWTTDNSIHKRRWCGS